MKYDRYEANEAEAVQSGELRRMVTPDERILWEGKPKRKVFIWENVITLMPIALIWLAIDAGFIFMMVSFDTGMPKSFLFILIPFFLIHLAPVWMWVAKASTASKRHKNMEYLITDKRVLIKSGFIGSQVINIMMKDISGVTVHKGVLDAIFKVGDVYISSSGIMPGKQSYANSIIDIEDAETVMQLIQKTAYDMQADISYPNAFRPEENDGYNTKYKG